MTHSIHIQINVISHFRFGRLKTVIIGMLFSSIFGLIKSFSISYLMYIIVSITENEFMTIFNANFVCSLNS